VKVVLDTNVVGKLCHPTNPKNKAFVEAFLPIVESGNVEIYLPEIADYELRREMLRMLVKDKGWQVGLSRLDALKSTLSFLTIDSEVFLQAAKNWADAKSTGKKTGPDEALDGDSILAAQAMSVGGKIVSENERHLAIFCEVLAPQKFLDEAAKIV